MKELVFLLEEESAKSFLESFLPRIIDSSISTRLIAFEGKQDLEKQIIKKIRGYINQDARFIIMRDQDGNPDPKVIKTNLIDKCVAAGKANQSLIRIACRELETFYLGEFKQTIELFHRNIYNTTAGAALNHFFISQKNTSFS